MPLSICLITLLTEPIVILLAAKKDMGKLNIAPITVPAHAINKDSKTFGIILSNASELKSNGNIAPTKVAICAGIDTQRFADTLGDSMRVYPVKGYSVTIQLDDEESKLSAPKVSLLDDPKKIVSSRLGDRLRVAGTAELAGTNKDIRQDRIRPLLGWVREYFPGVSTENYTPWAGLRPMTPNMMPLIFESKAKGIFYNTGHGHLGWTLGAATGDLLAEKMIND